jgi:hypothetical protein
MRAHLAADAARCNPPPDAKKHLTGEHIMNIRNRRVTDLFPMTSLLDAGTDPGVFMLQMFATLVSLFLAGSALAVIALSLAGDWQLMLRALGLSRPLQVAPLPPRGRPLVYARQVRVMRISPRSAPHAAAA